jgi:hypothetical protein
MENYDANSVSQAGIVLAILSAILIPLIIVSVITIIGQWKVYSKAGQPGWAAIIPIYNTIVLLQIVGKPIWWIFLFLIPCVNIIFAIWTVNLLSKSFGQSEGFTVGLILLPFIFYPILGFGSYTYLGPAAAEAKNANPFDQFNNPPPPQV